MLRCGPGVLSYSQQQDFPMRPRFRLLTLVAAMALALPEAVPLAGQLLPWGGANAYRADLSARRAATMAALGNETMLVAWSAPARVYSADVNYEYRQDSNLLYLTGIEQEDTVLLLIPGSRGRREILFAREPNPVREHWFGRTLRPTEIAAMSGVEHVYPLSAFAAFLEGVLAGAGYQQSQAEADAEFGAFFAALRERKGQLAVLDRVSAVVASEVTDTRSTNSPAAVVRRLHEQHPELGLMSAVAVIERQRQVKTTYEQAVLRRSVEISAEAHVEGMRATRPGRWEYEVEAAIEYWFQRSGARSWAYPSIVASGPNATVLHYGASHRQMQAGDLLLVDAGANFQGMASDITRTYPVSGRFTSEQRQIYELVRRAQAAGEAAARLGSPALAIVRASRETMAEGLLSLGLISDPTQVGAWYTHSPVHGLGVDVHDPFDFETPLAPGMTFVIEPGLYFREEALTRLDQNRDGVQPAEGLRPSEIVRPRFERYRDMGVRIEDSYLMTGAGLERLSGRAPREVAEIERLLASAR
jgi:Xaa-Pro aminopeptidase